MKENEYKCARCHGVFEKGWSDEESKKEAEEIFGKHPDEWNDFPEVICDDCFMKIHPLKHPEQLQKAKLRI